MRKINFYTVLFFALCFLFVYRNAKAQPCPAGIAYNLGTGGAVSFSALAVSNNTSAVYFWNFGNNTSPVLSFSNGVTTTYTANGTYTVVLSYSTAIPNTTCIPTTTIININTVCGVNVNYSVPVPLNACNGSATATPVGFCSGVSYNWMQGTVSVGTGTGTVVNALCKGTTYTVFASAAGGPTCCSSSSGVFTVPNTTCGLTASFYNTAPAQSSIAPVYFYSTSTGTSTNMSYLWDWGDGSLPSVTTQNAQHTYTAGGTFSPKLRAINNLNLCKDSIIKPLFVPSICSLTANFSAANQGNGLFNFLSNSTGTNGSTTYIWRFGDGINGSGASTAHTYSSSGTYTVKLIANNNSSITVCKDSISVPISVNLAAVCSLTANFAATTASNVVGAVLITNTSVGTIGASTYSWNWGDGNVSTVQSPTLHTYQANGTYVISLLVTNSPSCTSIKTQTVTITNITVPCLLSANFTHTVGALGVVNFADASSGTNNLTNYFWDFGDGTYGGSNAPTHTYNVNGAYNVKLVIKDTAFLSCRDSIIYSLNITGLACVANANFNLSPSGTPQYWNAIPAYPWNVTAATWNWGDGSTDNVLYSSHLYASPGTYSICLTVTVSCGASAGTCTSAAVYKSQNPSQDQTIVYVNVVKPALVTAIADYAQSEIDFVVFPNPNTGAFSLNIKGLTVAHAEVSIFNMVGQLVYQNENEAFNGIMVKDIQLDYAENGVYFIKVNADHKVFTKKIIINKQ